MLSLLLVIVKSSMPTHIEVNVTDGLPHALNPPALWTPEAAVWAKTALMVAPWQLPNGKWANAYDTSGVRWTTESLPVSKRARAGAVSAGAVHRVWRKDSSATRGTLTSMGETAFRKTGKGRLTKAVMGEDAYRQTQKGRAHALESARCLAAQGAGETSDGLTEAQRDALAEGVAAEASNYTNEALLSDDSAAAYIAVGSWERMVVNLQVAEANDWKNLSRCEIFASLLRSNPSALVLVDGTAQKFTSTLIRKVCAKPSLYPALHLSPSTLPPPTHPPTRDRASRRDTSRPSSARST